MNSIVHSGIYLISEFEFEGDDILQLLPVDTHSFNTTGLSFNNQSNVNRVFIKLQSGIIEMVRIPLPGMRAQHILIGDERAITISAVNTYTLRAIPDKLSLIGSSDNATIYNFVNTSMHVRASSELCDRKECILQQKMNVLHDDVVHGAITHGNVGVRLR